MDSKAIIQCSSSSSHVMRTYDVFVSFRGEDTRNNITDLLLGTLHSKGIDVFKDNEDLRKGESIAPELLQAIQGSRIFVVVFSKNYASSTWCLRELAHICNCVETSQRSVLPIFYDVDPSDVRKQSGCYENAFAEYEERFRQDKEKMEEVKTWREALTKVANHGGWDIRNKPLYKETEEIVQKITNMLGHKFSSLPKDNLVGMESRVEELVKRLCLGSTNDVRVVGISGMSGIGKTTLARALYEKISDKFDFHCLIDDVSKIYQDSGALGVQKQLLSQCLNEKKEEINNASLGTCLAWRRLYNAKALIVFDNVVNDGQLQMFTGNRDSLLRECLGGGSRIIIISRDEHILKTHGVDDVYQVPLLDEEEAIQLFCRNAFKRNYIMHDYEWLIDDILSYAEGHPLAIEVVGSSLFGRSVSQWRSTSAKLREHKSKGIMDVLRIGFDDLDYFEKEIFLDIACFFNEFEVQHVKEILDFRGFYPEHGLQVLIDKSLITIKFGEIRMHGLLIDLGRCIVQEKSPKEPSNWSRLWEYQDLHKIMSNNMAVEKLEAIDVQYESDDAVEYEPDDEEFHETIIRADEEFHETIIRVDALSKMSHIKLLKLKNVTFSGSLNHLSNELGYLDWEQYPFVCLPPSFRPSKLVELYLSHNNIKYLWKGRKPLHNLRRLDLSHSKNLIELPDFGEALNLELLNLEGCIKLKKIHRSIGLLRKLRILNLKDCKSLVSLPNNILCLNSLEYLNLYGCSELYNTRLLEEPRDAEQLKKLCIGEATDSKSVSSILKSWFMWPLGLWYSRAHEDSSVGYLSPSWLTIPCMCRLDLSYCNLVQIPDAIGNLHCLESLSLRGNNFATLPNLKELSKLRYLNLEHCKQLEYLPELPSRTDVSYHAIFTSLSLPKFPPLAWGSRPLYIEVDTTETEVGLNIFNCPELVEREGCTSMGLSWMIQIVQGHYQCGCELFCCEWPPHISSIVPGSEIPGWFNTQHVRMSSLITIDRSHLIMQHDNNCIGFACCVVFAVHSGRETNLEMGPPRRKACGYECMIPVDLHQDVVTDKSDHMWLFYYDPNLDNGPFPFDIMEIDIDIMDGEGFHFEVKKYVYRWVYEQDLQLSPNKTTTRKRKRGTDE